MIKKTFLAFTTLLLLTACQPKNDEPTPSKPVACTDEAKVCPDGSYVGRTGPNCEFSACPEVKPPENLIPENTDTTGWKSVTDENGDVSFKYPDPLPTKYTSLLTDEEFHPRIALSTEEFACEESTSQTGSITVAKTLNEKSYCVKTEREGAAGSTYATYTYTTTRPDQKNNLIALEFSLRQPNCGNYDDPQKTACEKELVDFKVDDLAVQILGTFK